MRKDGTAKQGPAPSARGTLDLDSSAPGATTGAAVVAALSAASAEPVQRDDGDGKAGGRPVGGADDALEGKYLAQIKKSKALAVQLEAQKNISRQLQGQLDSATARLDALASQQPPQPSRQRRGKKGSSAAVKAIPFLDVNDAGVTRHGLGDDDGDKGNADDDDDTDAVRQLKERLERAYSQVRDRDVQLSEAKRESTQLKAILGRELGKTPEELQTWLAQAAGGRGGGGGGEGPDGWKSRAEQIALLRGRLKDLERVMAAYQGSGELPRLPSPPIDSVAGTDGGGASVSSAPTPPPPTQQQRLNKNELAALVADGGDDLESLMQLALRTCPKDEASGATASPSTPPRPNRTATQDASPGSAVSRETASRVNGPTTTSVKRSVDDEARDVISDIAGKRLKGLREVEAELARTQEAVKEEKAKQAAAQARAVSLQRDNTQLRSHLQLMLEKSRGDDELVEAYKTELAAAMAVAQSLKAELAEMQREQQDEQQQSRPGAGSRTAATSSAGKLPHVATEDPSVEALTRENAELKKRLHALELTSQSSSPGSYESHVVRWALEAAGAAEDGPEQTAGTPVAALLRAAHAHLLLLEKRLQQLEDGHGQVFAGYNANRADPMPALPQALLVENANLKERVKSLTELLRREAQVKV